MRLCKEPNDRRACTPAGWLLWCFLITLHTTAMALGPPRTEASGELLEGLWTGSDNRIAVFRGIPFAAPPTGELRWRNAETPRPRQGLLAAKTFASACMQGNYSTGWYQRLAAHFLPGIELQVKPAGVSEDCLYLNIWSPELAADAALPVIVWVYGFSNKAGWSYEPNYDGVKLAERGVVLVTIAYRVGVFGYFSHPLLDNGPGQAVANFGLTDSARALQWISDNITAFGGDPGNITLAGESSGAGNILDLLVAGAGKPRLFRRAIIQSTGQSVSTRRTLEQERIAGARLIDSLSPDVENLTMNDLRQIPAEDLLHAVEEEFGDHYFEAVVDGLTLPLTPLQVYDSGQLAGIELLIGSNRDEWYMYFDDSTDWQDVDQWLSDNAPGAANILRNLVKHESDPRRALDRLVSASQFHCPSRYISERVAAAGGSAWMYHFNRVRFGIGGNTLGAYHGAEIPYVFDSHDQWLPTDPADRVLTDTVMDYWVQFARTGNPNGTGRPGWPPYLVAEPWVMQLGDQVGVMPMRDAELCLWLAPGKTEH